MAYPSSKSIQNVDSETESFPFLTVDELSSSLANISQANISYLTANGGNINSTSIGSLNPSSGIFTSLVAGANGQDVLFNTINPNDYLKWGGTTSLLDVMGSLMVRDNFRVGDLNINGTSLLTGKTNNIHIGIVDQLNQKQIKDGYLNLAGPINQHNLNGCISLWTHTRDEVSGGLYFNSATSAQFRTGKRLSLETNYDDVIITAAIQPSFAVKSSKIEDSTLILETDPELFATEGIYPGDLIELRNASHISSSHVLYIDDVKSIIGVEVNPELEGDVMTFRKTDPVGGRVILNASKAVLLNEDTPIYFDGYNQRSGIVYQDHTLKIESDSSISISPRSGDVRIPENVHLAMGAHFIKSSGAELSLVAQQTISLITGTSVNISSGKPIVLSSFHERIRGFDGKLDIYSDNGTINLQSKFDVTIRTVIGNVKLEPVGDVVIPTKTRIKIGESAFIMEEGPRLVVSNQNQMISFEAKNLILPDASKLKFGDYATIESSDSKLVIDAQSTVITGNLTVMGERVLLNTTVHTITDPVIELGSNINVLDVKDRGISFRYGLDKVGFFGFKQKTGKFTFIPECTSYQNDMFDGPPGKVTFDVGNIETSIITGDPDLYISAPNGSVIFQVKNGVFLPTSSTLHFGDKIHVRGDSLGRLICDLPGGLSISRGLITLNDGVFLDGNQSRLWIGSKTIQIGDTNDNLTLNVVDGIMTLSGLRIGSTVLNDSEDKFEISGNKSIWISSSLYLDGEILKGVWKGNVISLSSGGTNRSSPWTPKCIPYIGDNCFTESSNFTFDDAARELHIFGLSVRSDETVSYISEQLRIHRTDSKVEVVTELDVQKIRASKGVLRLCADVGISGEEDGFPLNFTSSLSFTRNSAKLGWAGSNEEISVTEDTLTISSDSLVNFRSQGIRLRETSSIQWDHGVSICGFRDGLMRVHADVLHFNQPVSLIFGDTGCKIENDSNATSLIDPKSILLSAPTIRLDGNVILHSSSIFTSIPLTSLDPSLLEIGGGSSLDITDVKSGTNGFIIITTASKHYLTSGDSCIISGSNAVPDVDGLYRINEVIDEYSVAILTTIDNLERTGTKGKLKTRWQIDPALDVGIKLNYYRSSAFIGLQYSSGRFAIMKKYDTAEYGDLQLRSVYGTGELSGFKINSVSLENWTTTSQDLIANLNAELLGGLTRDQFIHTSGLNVDWDAGSDKTITCGSVRLANLKPKAVPFVHSDGTLTHSYQMIYDILKETLICNLDVSGRMLILDDGQIPGNKIGGGIASCDISGNSKTTTNGLYTTDFNGAYVILATQRTEKIVHQVKVNVGCVIGRIGDGPIQSISSDVFGGGLQTYPPVRTKVKTGESVVLEGAKMIFVEVNYGDGSAIATGSLNDGDYIDGEEKIIYVTMDNDCMFDLAINLSTPDGISGMKIARFDRSFQSIHICYDIVTGSWFLINSGVTICS